MIVEDIAENQVTIGGNLQVGTFSIKESAKAFSILSSSLYSKKIKAIIRELSCNARDSRIAAGLPQDFYVHLPTRMEPEFWVKDEGLGLSNSEVMNLYTTYFESTKSSSNAFVGALGLGSKSPFSYTENFTVTAIKDGTRGVYSAFINELGVPSIVCLFSGPTDEVNGVEVRMAVADKDHREFLEEAQNIYNWFDIKPTCNVSLNYFYNTVREHKHDHYSENTSNKSIVLMGGVAYEFEMFDFDVNAPAIKFLFRMEIGEVDILPSREGLQNTLKTKTAIVNAVNKSVTAVEQEVLAELSKIDSVYDKLAYLSDTAVSKMHMHIFNKVKTAQYPGATAKVVAFSKLDELGMKCSKYSHRIGKKATKAVLLDSVSPSKYVKFVFNDIGVSVSNIKDQLKDYSSTVYIFSKLDKTSVVDFEKFRQGALLGATVILASSFIVKTVREVVSKRNTSGVMIPVGKYSNSYRNDYKLTNGVSVPISAKYYARLDANGKYMIDGIEVNISSMVELVGIHSIVFLKKSSKADISTLIEFGDHIASLMIPSTKYKFPNMGYDYRNLRDLINNLNESELKVDDPDFMDISSEYVAFDEYSNGNKLLAYMNANCAIYPDTRKYYDDKILSKTQTKYSIIDCDSGTDPHLLQIVMNSIHTHYESKK